MVANGLALRVAPLSELVHEVVEHGPADADAGARVEEAVRALLDAGVDANAMRRRDFFAPLHLACRRGLVPVVALLLERGSDPNAVAAEDAMPLGCCDEAEDEAAREAISALLLARGARRTWRRDPPLAPPDPGTDGGGFDFSTEAPALVTKFVSFRGGF